MHIVIDLQGAQLDSRFRGIGRYSLSLAKAIVSNKGEHSVTLALNGLFPESVAPIRAEFSNLLTGNNIRVWYAPGPVYEYDKKNTWRRKAAELLREAFFAGLGADIVFVSSFIEGYAQDGVTSACEFSSELTTAATLYDLIPLLNRAQYLDLNPSFEKYYMRKIEQLKKADGLLAISDYSEREGTESLQIKPSRICNISSGCDDFFRPVAVSGDELSAIGITRPFILYAGGADSRKNLPRLLKAYALLPRRLRDEYMLVIVGKIKKVQKIYLDLVIAAAEIAKNEVLFTGYVIDETLVKLYSGCSLFVFPSWHEGFGLPALEAIKCGAPVVGSCTSSLPEVIGCGEALFDPFNVKEMSEKIKLALSDVVFRKKLKDIQSENAEQFSWDNTARSAIAFFEKIKIKPTPHWDRETIINKLTAKIAQIDNAVPTREDLLSVSVAIAKNHPMVSNE